MADFSTLISRIKAAIKPNGAGQITGQVMQDALVKTGEGIVQEINAAKQDTLVSGTNIKTVGGQSLLGAGDIPVSGGGAGNLRIYVKGDFDDGLKDGSNIDTYGEEWNLDGVNYTSFEEFVNALAVGQIIIQLENNILTPTSGYPLYENVKVFVVRGLDAEGSDGPEAYLTRIDPGASAHPPVGERVDISGMRNCGNTNISTTPGLSDFVQWMQSYKTSDGYSDDISQTPYPFRFMGADGETVEEADITFRPNGGTSIHADSPYFLDVEYDPDSDPDSVNFCFDY